MISRVPATPTAGSTDELALDTQDTSFASPERPVALPRQRGRHAAPARGKRVAAVREPSAAAVEQVVEQGASRPGRHRRAPLEHLVLEASACADVRPDSTAPAGLLAAAEAGAAASSTRSTAGRHRRPARTADPRRHLALPLTLIIGVTATAFSLATEHSHLADAATMSQRVGVTETDARAALVHSRERVSRTQMREALATTQAATQAQVASRIAAVRDDLTADAQRDAALTAAQAAAKIRELERPEYVLPVAAGRYHLTAGFGEVSGLWAHRHTGQDFAAPIGTPVVAVEDGTIVSAGWDGPYGRKIVVRAADGTETWYCHLSAFVLTSGTVKAGTLIGKVGNTGNTTGPHLHLEVRVDGQPINPMPWLRAHGLKP